MCAPAVQWSNAAGPLDTPPARQRRQAGVPPTPRCAARGTTPELLRCRRTTRALRYRLSRLCPKSNGARPDSCSVYSPRPEHCGDAVALRRRPAGFRQALAARGLPGPGRTAGAPAAHLGGRRDSLRPALIPRRTAQTSPPTMTRPPRNAPAVPRAASDIAGNCTAGICVENVCGKCPSCGAQNGGSTSFLQGLCSCGHCTRTAPWRARSSQTAARSVCQNARDARGCFRVECPSTRPAVFQ